jgi:hypothetical protein
VSSCVIGRQICAIGRQLLVERKLVSSCVLVENLCNWKTIVVERKICIC